MHGIAVAGLGLCMNVANRYTLQRPLANERSEPRISRGLLLGLTLVWATATYYRTDLNINKGLGKGFEIWLTARNLFDRKNRFPGIWNAEDGIPGERFNVSLGVRWGFR